VLFKQKTPQWSLLCCRSIYSTSLFRLPSLLKLQQRVHGMSVHTHNLLRWLDDNWTNWTFHKKHVEVNVAWIPEQRRLTTGWKVVGSTSVFWRRRRSRYATKTWKWVKSCHMLDINKPWMQSTVCFYGLPVHLTSAVPLAQTSPFTQGWSDSSSVVRGSCGFGRNSKKS